MASGNEHFHRSGPVQLLKTLDWNNAHDRRSVAASLIKGVRLMEKDRQKGRSPQSQLAPPWWKFLKLKLINKLVDDDKIIFGAIFEYKPQDYAYHDHRAINRSPRYVVAFRGTMLWKPKTLVRDAKLDINIVRNELHKTNSFKIALKAVQNLVAGGDSNIWLTGYSLGAAMGILVGKNMAKRGYCLESLLFNPPFVSPPIERIKCKIVRSGIRFTGDLIKFGIGIAFAAAGNGYQDSFDTISRWSPNLYVNQSDLVCGEYISHFKHRKNLEDNGLGCVARVSSQHSLGNIAMSAVGLMDLQTSESPLHLLPSANLIENLNPSRNPFRAHKLSEWWKTDLNLRCSVYKYK